MVERSVVRQFESCCHDAEGGVAPVLGGGGQEAGRLARRMGGALEVLGGFGLDVHGGSVSHVGTGRYRVVPTGSERDARPGPQPWWEVQEGKALLVGFGAKP